MAERLVYKSHCGCEVYRIMNHKPNLYRIQYCATHLAAPQLYEALKGLMSEYAIPFVFTTEDERYYPDCWANAKKALALMDK